MGRAKSQKALRKVTTQPGVGKSHNNTSSCRERVTTRAGEKVITRARSADLFNQSLQRFVGYVLRARLLILQFSKTAFFLNDLQLSEKKGLRISVFSPFLYLTYIMFGDAENNF